MRAAACPSGRETRPEPFFAGDVADMRDDVNLVGLLRAAVDVLNLHPQPASVRAAVMDPNPSVPAPL